MSSACNTQSVKLLFSKNTDTSVSRLLTNDNNNSLVPPGFWPTATPRQYGAKTRHWSSIPSYLKTANGTVSQDFSSMTGVKCLFNICL